MFSVEYYDVNYNWVNVLVTQFDILLLCWKVKLLCYKEIDNHNILSVNLSIICETNKPQGHLHEIIKSVDYFHSYPTFLLSFI